MSRAAIAAMKPPVADYASNSSMVFAPVRGRAQDVERTGSRRAEPRAWLRSVVWLIGAGLHPKAGGSTVVVARDLAARMDYRRGIVLYDLDGTVARTGLSRATVKRHVAVLRELGALVWLVHGSKRNLRMPGRAYTATATIYGAVTPPAFDEAMGHRLSGSGYEGRVCGVTAAGRERATAMATAAAREKVRRESRRGLRGTGRRPTAKPGGTSTPGRPLVDNSPVDNRRPEGREPHSLGRSPWAGKDDVDGGGYYTSRERASRTTPLRPEESSSNSDGQRRRTASQVRRAMWITRQVRARVNWAQGERLRRLEFVLRPLTDAGLDADTIAAELHSWMLTFRPARPADYIHAQLLQQSAATHHAEQAEAAEGWDEDEASGAFTASRPDLVRSVLDGLAQGLSTYSARQAAQGLDDLSGADTAADATADMAAFLRSGAVA